MSRLNVRRENFLINIFLSSHQLLMSVQVIVMIFFLSERMLRNQRKENAPKRNIGFEYKVT